MLHHDLAEDLARLNGLQADIGIDRGLNAAVTENASDEFVLAGPALEDESRGGMPELVHGHAHSSRLVDALGDLAAERDLPFGASSLPREQPVLIPASHQGRPEVVDVFVDQSGQTFLEREFQP
jgi:hypothetical protein